MSSRDDILARVRGNQPPPRALPELPSYADAEMGRFDVFRAALERMGGKVAVAPKDGRIDALVHRLHPEARVVCSAAAEVAGNRPIASVRSPADLHDVDVGIVRAQFGVAETGSVLVTDAEFQVDALGFLAQHLVVLLDPGAIVANMHVAYQKRVFFEARYAVFMTGPSATADIEGVLIHGAQGIRSLTVIPVAA